MTIDVDTIFGFWPVRRCDITLDRVLELMERYAIDRACICSARGIWYDDEEGNQETREAASRYPNLVPVATFDPRKFTNASTVIRRWVDGGGRIFRLFPEYQGWSVNGPSMRRILGMLDDAGVVIVVGGSASQVLPELKGLHTPVILVGAHLYQLADVLACADEMPNVYLSTRLLIGPGSIEIAASQLGFERLVFGSHAPLVYLGSALRVVQSAQLTAEEREGIMHANLWRLIGGVRDHH